MGSVVLREPEAATERIRVFHQVTGYKDGWSWVRLFKPGELASTSYVEDVELIPDPPHEVGTVRVRCPRRVEGLRRPSRAELWIRGQWVLALHGRPLGDETWEFRGVPAARHQVTVFDGASESEPQSVDVPAGGVAVAEVRFGPPMGVVLDLRDSAGRALFDADYVGFGRIEGGEGDELYASWAAAPDVTAAEIDPTTGELLPGFVRIPVPGLYEVTVTKPGYDQSQAEFRIEKDRVTTSVVTLEKHGK